MLERVAEWWRYADKAVIAIWAVGIALVGVIVLCVVMAIASMNQFQRDCESAGGWVKSTHTGNTIIVQPKGGVVIVPQYDYECIIP